MNTDETREQDEQEHKDRGRTPRKRRRSTRSWPGRRSHRISTVWRGVPGWSTWPTDLQRPDSTAVDAAAGAVLDRVGPDRRRADDRLGHGAQQVPDAFPHQPVGGRHPALEGPQEQEQRQEADPDQDRELPRVHEHHGQGSEDDRAVDDPGDGAQTSSEHCQHREGQVRDTAAVW